MDQRTGLLLVGSSWREVTGDRSINNRLAGHLPEECLLGRTPFPHCGIRPPPSFGADLMSLRVISAMISVAEKDEMNLLSFNHNRPFAVSKNCDHRTYTWPRQAPRDGRFSLLSAVNPKIIEPCIRFRTLPERTRIARLQLPRLKRGTYRCSDGTLTSEHYWNESPYICAGTCRRQHSRNYPSYGVWFRSRLYTSHGKGLYDNEAQVRSMGIRMKSPHRPGRKQISQAHLTLRSLHNR